MRGGGVGGGSLSPTEAIESLGAKLLAARG